MARYVIFGAGAIGGVVGARLHAAGRSVALIARGDHYDAIARSGLVVEHPGGSETHRIPVFPDPRSATVAPGDVVVLTTKSQDSHAALAALAACCGPETAVVCAQNGVDNERSALRRFPHVYGGLVVMPAAHLRPGVVSHAADPVPGALDLGGAPSGRDERAAAIAEDLRAAGFASEAVDDVMAWKRRKLLTNVANTVNALFVEDETTERIIERAREEGRACLAAARLDVVAETAYEQRIEFFREQTVDDRLVGGSSSWQSLARGIGTIEADYLNGEIALLGRLHGIPTPVNAALQRLANEHAARRTSPGSLAVAELEKLLQA